MVSDAAIRGQVFCSFLALIVRKELDERCRMAGFRPEWGDGLRDLDRLQEVAITQDTVLGKPVRVTDVTGVAEKLKAVSTEIDALPDALKRTAYPIAGVLACRSVRDTGRDSMHAYAAAIDLNAKMADYWLWQATSGAGPLPYRNRMPQEIVDVFERHGFIWGGKWYHYDTMHFEYRPELLGTTPKP